MADSLLSLSPRQLQTMMLVEDAIARTGRPPTVRELGLALGGVEKQCVADFLTALVRKGYLERLPGRTARNLRVLRSVRGAGAREVADIAAVSTAEEFKARIPAALDAMSPPDRVAAILWLRAFIRGCLDAFPSDPALGFSCVRLTRPEDWRQGRAVRLLSRPGSAPSPGAASTR